MSIITEALKKAQDKRIKPQNEELHIETTEDILTSPAKITIEKAEKKQKPVFPGSNHVHHRQQIRKSFG